MASPPSNSIAAVPGDLRMVAMRQNVHVRLDSVAIWMLSAFAFVLPTDLRLGDGRSLAMRLGFACLLLGLAGVVERRSVVIPQRGFWLLTGFVAWSSCTLAWARYPYLAEHKVLLYWAVFAAAAMLPQYAWEPSTRAALMKAYVAGCWLGVLGTGVNFALSRPYRAGGEDPMEGRYSFGTDPNYLGLALVIGIPLALYTAEVTSARWQKMVLRFYIPAAALGIFLTGSRGASMALLAVAGIYALRAPKRIWLLLLGGGALWMALVAMVPSQSERFTSIPDALRYGTLSDRRELWTAGAAIVRDHPLAGIGVGGAEGSFAIAAHNTPLELALEGGLVSLILFYGVFLAGLARTLKHDRREGWHMTAACVAWLIGGLALSWEIQTITWFLAMILNSTLPVRPLAPDAPARDWV